MTEKQYWSRDGLEVITGAAAAQVAEAMASTSLDMDMDDGGGHTARYETCRQCGRDYRYPHLCREHMLCGICHPPV